MVLHNCNFSEVDIVIEFLLHLSNDCSASILLTENVDSQSRSPSKNNKNQSYGSAQPKQHSLLPSRNDSSKLQSSRRLRSSGSNMSPRCGRSSLSSQFTNHSRLKNHTSFICDVKRKPMLSSSSKIDYENIGNMLDHDHYSHGTLPYSVGKRYKSAPVLRTRFTDELASYRSFDSPEEHRNSNNSEDSGISEDEGSYKLENLNEETKVTGYIPTNKSSIFGYYVPVPQDHTNFDSGRDSTTGIPESLSSARIKSKNELWGSSFPTNRSSLFGLVVDNSPLHPSNMTTVSYDKVKPKSFVTNNTIYLPTRDNVVDDTTKPRSREGSSKLTSQTVGQDTVESTVTPTLAQNRSDRVNNLTKINEESRKSSGGKTSKKTSSSNKTETISSPNKRILKKSANVKLRFSANMYPHSGEDKIFPADEKCSRTNSPSVDADAREVSHTRMSNVNKTTQKQSHWPSRHYDHSQVTFS